MWNKKWMGGKYTVEMTGKFWTCPQSTDLLHSQTMQSGFCLNWGRIGCLWSWGLVAICIYIVAHIPYLNHLMVAVAISISYHGYYGWQYRVESTILSISFLFATAHSRCPATIRKTSPRPPWILAVLSRHVDLGMSCFNPHPSLDLLFIVVNSYIPRSKPTTQTTELLLGETPRIEKI